MASILDSSHFEVPLFQKRATHQKLKACVEVQMVVLNTDIDILSNLLLIFTRGQTVRNLAFIFFWSGSGFEMGQYVGNLKQISRVAMTGLCPR